MKQCIQSYCAAGDIDDAATIIAESYDKIAKLDLFVDFASDEGYQFYNFGNFK